MARPTVSTFKRLQGLEATQASRGVMVVPPLMTIAQWEALAVPAQAKLIEDCAQDRQDKVEAKAPA